MQMVHCLLFIFSIFKRNWSVTCRRGLTIATMSHGAAVCKTFSQHYIFSFLIYINKIFCQNITTTGRVFPKYVNIVCIIKSVIIILIIVCFSCIIT